MYVSSYRYTAWPTRSTWPWPARLSVTRSYSSMTRLVCKIFRSGNFRHDFATNVNQIVISLAYNLPLHLGNCSRGGSVRRSPIVARSPRFRPLHPPSVRPRGERSVSNSSTENETEWGAVRVFFVSGDRRGRRVFDAHAGAKEDDALLPRQKATAP